MAVENAREIFATYFPEKLEKNPEITEKVNTTYKFVVEGDNGGTWLVDLTQPGGQITEGDGDAKCTVTLKEETLVDMVNGKVNPQMAFMTGKLKVSDVGAALKLTSLLG